MKISDFPDDIQEAARAALDEIDIYGCGDDGGSVAYEHLAAIAIAYAIKQERIRCAELAYRHYIRFDDRKGAAKLVEYIARGDKASSASANQGDRNDK